MKQLLSIATLVLVFSCKETKPINKLEEQFNFPKNLKEVSGIYYNSNSKLIWSIEDSGNENEIYALDSIGNIIKTIQITDIKNIDWEDITQDKTGNIYIGDFGNNDNKRKDLAIYQILSSDCNNNKVETSKKIGFHYPEQTSFPPKKKDLIYDCEGFFEHNNHFYLFTKNRSKDFDGTTSLYKIPNEAGNHEAKLIGKFITCNEDKVCAITSIAISPDEKKVALLTHKKVWILSDFTSDDFTKGKSTEIDLNHLSQKEAITFKNNTTLLIADEKVKKEGGNLYEFKLN